MSTTRQELLRLLARRSFKLGEFTLSSGTKSDYYIDCRITTLDARGAQLTGRLFLEEIQARGWKPHAIGGLTMGADPIVVAVSVTSGNISGFLVRKAEKQHGTGQRIEGFQEKGARAVIVDDVCTTGASTVQAIEAAREFGFNVIGVMCLVEREEANGRPSVEKAAAPAPFISVFTANDVRKEHISQRMTKPHRACWRLVRLARYAAGSRLRIIRACAVMYTERDVEMELTSTEQVDAPGGDRPRPLSPETRQAASPHISSDQGLTTVMIQTLEWTPEGVRFIDQTKLPTEETYVNCTTHQQVADVIRNMVVRGAPAIGVAAGMGIALGVQNSKAENTADLKKEFDEICRVIGETRPTAVNLFWAIRRMQDKFELLRVRPIPHIKQTLVEEAQRMHAEDIAANQAMGRHGATLMPSTGGVLTHCNAGALATAGYGTALGVIRAAIEAGKKIHVYADETRPFLQGSRLTAWELIKDGIPTTVISDNMAGAMMMQGKIGAIVVGADRIAANGDVANKIGTYTVAVLAKEHGIPFYVAAPISTVDLATADGSGIPIEQRNQKEVTHIAGKQMVPEGVSIENPAFDVTPAKYVAAIITERGIAKAPYGESLRELAKQP